MKLLKRNLPRAGSATVVAAILMCVAVPAVIAASSSDNVDLSMVTRIRQEGFRNSKVMETESELTDRIGPRLTGSTNLKQANEWTRDQMTKWGLVNAHLEAFPFGRGWALDSVSVRMTAPTVSSLYALPKAWTPGTNGVIKGEVVRLKATTVEELVKEKGKYTGKIVLIGETREIKPQSEAALKRYDDGKLRELGLYEVPSAGIGGMPGRQFTREELMKRFQFTRALQKFLADEKIAASIEPSRGDAGLIFVQGTNAYKAGEPDGFPQLVMAYEHYGRIVRLMDRKVPVELELEVKAHFDNADPNSYNTVAEIQGTDKKDEIVMVGGHLDSWHGGTGATDNAAGSAIAMEAMRILQSLGVKPRRTIRIGLWGGEEEGLLGSRAYVSDHFGKREEPAASPNALPSYMRSERELGPLTLKPEQAKISAYFNVDNGTGKLRGIYLQENAAAEPIMTAWAEPFRDLGVTTVSMRNTGGTDHLSFDGVGIPGFQFIQDPVEYDARTHHSNMDVYERIQRDDMMQASVVLAAFLYDAAMRDEMLPRKPLPPNTNISTVKAETNATTATPGPKKVAKDKKKS